MPIIKVKRGTTTPTTSNLTQVGEIGFNTTNNELFIRGNSSVVRIGSIEELAYTYTGNLSTHLISHVLSNEYIYKLYVFASTNYKGNDNSQTILNYRSSAGVNFNGSYLTVFFNDLYNSSTKLSSRNTSGFLIADAFSNSVVPTYAITKTIEAELLPSFESNTSSTYQWIIKGTSISSVSDQANAAITMADFVHSVDGAIGQIFIDPGLDLGTIDTIQISLYRKKRK